MKVLITGAGGGIGKACIEKFLNAGCEVFAHCRSKTQLSGLEDGKLKVIEKDISNYDDVNWVWERASESDCIINTIGGVVGSKSIVELDPEEVSKTFFVNLHIPLRFSQLAARTWLSEKRKGHIINFSSIGVKYGGSKTSSHYSAAKLALEQMSRSLSRDFAAQGVRCNVLRVGVVNTDLHKKMGKPDLSARAELIPLKRVATPEEVAIYVYSMTQAPEFLTGSVIDFAGGE